jgi:LmbE family N-acetylglucosaminyl deacetylase
MQWQPSIERTMIIAPHPDDDVIAAGGLLQRVVAAGGDVSVVFVTDGENNPWPQRYMQRRWFLGSEDRAAWGAMRRSEALCSLARLGVPKASTRFLAFPDQQIAGLARRGDLRLRDELRAAVDEFRPTLIVSPSANDLHSDHRAIAWFAHAAAQGAEITTYLVHGTPQPERLMWTVILSERERRRKLEAIECHTSQLALSRTRFLAHAGFTESFCAPEFDLVSIDSTVREWMMALRHGLGVLAGAMPIPQPSGIQPAADVQDSPGDVAGLL